MDTGGGWSALSGLEGADADSDEDEDSDEDADVDAVEVAGAGSGDGVPKKFDESSTLST